MDHDAGTRRTERRGTQTRWLCWCCFKQASRRSGVSHLAKVRGLDETAHHHVCPAGWARRGLLRRDHVRAELNFHLHTVTSLTMPLSQVLLKCLCVDEYSLHQLGRRPCGGVRVRKPYEVFLPRGIFGTPHPWIQTDFHRIGKTEPNVSSGRAPSHVQSVPITNAQSESDVCGFSS
jgi:hypothetical protein